MSKKTNIGKKPIIKDFGIQPYRKCDKDYPEVIRTPTFFAANDATVVRESEFAKPYDESEDYSGMEYAAPNWPWTDWPGIDYPGMDLPVPNFPEMYDPWKMYFRCNVDPCWCEGETRTFGAGCTYEIVAAQFNPSEDYLSVSFTKNTISITALSGIGEDESGKLTITMLARVPKGGTLWQGRYDPVYGIHGGISVGECDDCCNELEIAWDWDASDQTIGQSDTASVSVKDGDPPYDWSVSGSGFSLSLAQTTGLSNTLISDATACGAASISVTDACGKSASGSVRGTEDSHWVDKGLQCGDVTAGLSATEFPTANASNYQPVAIYGKGKQVVDCVWVSNSNANRCQAPGESIYDIVLADLGCPGGPTGPCISWITPCQTMHATYLAPCESTKNCYGGNCYWLPTCEPEDWCNTFRTNFSCTLGHYYEWECV